MKKDGDGEVKKRWNEAKKEGIRPGADDPINTRVYRAVMPVVVAYLLDTHLNLAWSRPGEPREKPHTSSTSHLGCLSSRKRVEPTMRANCSPPVNVENTLGHACEVTYDLLPKD